MNTILLSLLIFIMIVLCGLIYYLMFTDYFFEIREEKSNNNNIETLDQFNPEYCSEEYDDEKNISIINIKKKDESIISSEEDKKSNEQKTKHLIDSLKKEEVDNKYIESEIYNNFNKESINNQKSINQKSINQDSSEEDSSEEDSDSHIDTPNTEEARKIIENQKI